MVIRPENSDERPRLRFDRMISSNRTILGSFALGFARSRSLMNSLKPSNVSWKNQQEGDVLTLSVLQVSHVLRMLCG